MNENLGKVLERIVEEEELTREFSKYDDMDEMYDYCTELGGGYTEEEFDEGIAEVINELHLQSRGTTLSDEDLGYVAGGMNLGSMFSKTASVMLAALTVGGIGMPFNAKAAEVSPNIGETQTVSSIKAEDSGKWSKTKEALSNFWKDHKKKIIIGATVLTAGAVVSGATVWAYKHREATKKNSDAGNLEQSGEKVETKKTSGATEQAPKENLAVEKRQKEADAKKVQEEAEELARRKQQEADAKKAQEEAEELAHRKQQEADAKKAQEEAEELAHRKQQEADAKKAQEEAEELARQKQQEAEHKEAEADPEGGYSLAEELGLPNEPDAFFDVSEFTEPEKQQVYSADDIEVPASVLNSIGDKLS